MQTVTADRLTKIYPVYQNNREKYLDFFLPRPFGDRFCALKEVSFTLSQGQSLGLLGWNGSGKSTLAHIIAGAITPTSGTVSVTGRVSLLSIGAGILPALTGLENITQKCLWLGLSPAEIESITPEIIAFSELGDCIHQPVKTYSSGMRARLGFSISTQVQPDILIIDEALSVGDATFTQKCLAKMNQFRQQGKTLLFVSHSAAQIREFCDTALWLEGGEMQAFGSCSEILSDYLQFLKSFQERPAKEQEEYKAQLRAKQYLNR